MSLAIPPKEFEVMSHGIWNSKDKLVGLKINGITNG